MATTTSRLSLLAPLILSTLLHQAFSQTPRGSMASSPPSVISQFLTPHNKLRERKGLPPLKWSDSLTNFARRYANQRKGDCSLIHSSGDLGENIFWGSGSRWKPADAVKAWAAEELAYDYKHSRCIGAEDCLHYTQMVWRTTKKIGCAQVTCKSGDTFITCNYFPHGNVIGQRPY